MKSIIAISLLSCLAACQAEPKQTTNNTPTPKTPEPTPVHQPTIAEQLANATTLQDAWRACAPLGMKDEFDSFSYGGFCLTAWGTSHYSWNMVSVSQDETTPGLVFKNVYDQLGKRICAAGTVVEITEGNNGIGEGELQGFSGHLYHFYTAGGSGSIVARSTAHLCGFVVGTYSYHNSGGGASHAVDISGMWDMNYHPQEW